jgi:hypothetical protein
VGGRNSVRTPSYRCGSRPAPAHSFAQPLTKVGWSVRLGRGQGGTWAMSSARGFGRALPRLTDGMGGAAGWCGTPRTAPWRTAAGSGRVSASELPPDGPTPPNWRWRRMFGWDLVVRGSGGIRRSSSGMRWAQDRAPSSYIDGKMDPVILASARKHGVADDDCSTPTATRSESSSSTN